MPLTLLVSAVSLTLSAHADSVRAVSKPATNRATTTVSVAADSTSDIATYDARFPADSIVVEKSAHRLSLFQRGRPVRTYLVALGQQPVGDKVRIGDLRTPEGTFTIEARNPASRYHRSLRISYPDSAHRARARALGVSPGGDIMIHGLPARQAYVGAAHRDFDWTEGCIAVTNAEIEEIWGAVPVGTRIHIKP
jgi:murein L,D-transpeptidase YafK